MPSAAAKLVRYLPRALAGDPTAIAILATAGFVIAAKMAYDKYCK